MAKGRKVGWSHQERWLVSDNTSQTEGPDGIELGEEDVWSMIDGALDHHDDPMLHGTQTPDWPDSHVEAMIRNQRLMSHDGARVGGLSLAFEDPSRTGAARIVHQFHTQENPKPSQRGRHVAASAPVHVPTWSRIGRVESAESLNEWDGGSVLSQEDESERVPPHEYLAREYARSHKNLVATSVFEGVGRTLKGRDASRVRDAVWSRTGFNGETKCAVEFLRICLETHCTTYWVYKNDQVTQLRHAFMYTAYQRQLIMHRDACCHTFPKVCRLFLRFSLHTSATWQSPIHPARQQRYVYSLHWSNSSSQPTMISSPQLPSARPWDLC